MPGYDQSLFVECPKRHLICAFCRLAIKDAVTINTCQHSFCENCLNEFLRDGSIVCPVDRKTLDYAQIFADEMRRVEMLSSKVRCLYFKDGCQWTDQLHNLQGHLEVCRFETVVCPNNNCHSRLSKAALNDHVTYTCTQRKVICSTCRQEFTGDTMEMHEGSCPMEPVWCEHKCGARVPRRHIDHHMHSTCVKRTTLCTHCQKEFLYETLNDHFLQCPRFPIACPNRCDASSSVTMCREDLSSHLNSLCPSTLAPCPFKAVGCKHSGRRSTLAQHSQDAMGQHVSLLSALVISQQHVINELSSQLDQTTAITNGTFIWKVTNFKSKLTKAKSSEDFELQSAPFYTSRHGYRLGVSLFPAGNGSGEGTHLSVYIRVLPGEYDNILEWPFRLPIVFKLFDQCSDPDKRRNVVESFTPNPSWKQFQKPVKDTDNSGFGYPKFIASELLHSGSYVRDDCIFIRIKVDVSKFIEP